MSSQSESILFVCFAFAFILATTISSSTSPSPSTEGQTTPVATYQTNPTAMGQTSQGGSSQAMTSQGGSSQAFTSQGGSSQAMNSQGGSTQALTSQGGSSQVSQSLTTIFSGSGQPSASEATEGIASEVSTSQYASVQTSDYSEASSSNSNDLSSDAWSSYYSANNEPSSSYGYASDQTSKSPTYTMSGGYTTINEESSSGSQTYYSDSSEFSSDNSEFMTGSDASSSNYGDSSSYSGWAGSETTGIYSSSSSWSQGSSSSYSNSDSSSASSSTSSPSSMGSSSHTGYGGWGGWGRNKDYSHSGYGGNGDYYHSGYGSNGDYYHSGYGGWGGSWDNWGGIIDWAVSGWNGSSAPYTYWGGNGDWAYTYTKPRQWDWGRNAATPAPLYCTTCMDISSTKNNKKMSMNASESMYSTLDDYMSSIDSKSSSCGETTETQKCHPWEDKCGAWRLEYAIQKTNDSRIELDKGYKIDNKGCMVSFMSCEELSEKVRYAVDDKKLDGLKLKLKSCSVEGDGYEGELEGWGGILNWAGFEQQTYWGGGGDWGYTITPQRDFKQAGDSGNAVTEGPLYCASCLNIATTNNVPQQTANSTSENIFSMLDSYMSRIDSNKGSCDATEAEKCSPWEDKCGAWSVEYTLQKTNETSTELHRGYKINGKGCMTTYMSCEELSDKVRFEVEEKNLNGLRLNLKSCSFDNLSPGSSSRPQRSSSYLVDLLTSISLYLSVISMRPL